MQTWKPFGWAVIGIVSGSLFAGTVQGADPVYRSWRLAGPPQGKDLFQPSGMLSSGSIRIDGFHADALGGVVQMTAKSPTQCPPGTGLPQGSELQRFRFTWRFDADVSRISASRGPMAVWFTIEGDRGTGCMDQNPYMRLFVDGDPIAYVDQRTNADFNFKQTPPHVGAPRTFHVYRSESWRRDVSFKIVIADFRHAPYSFQFETTYAYAGESAAAPQTDPHVRDLLARAGRDGRFGSAIPDSLGGQQWTPDWDLKWVDFVFSGNRRVRIYVAISRTNPAVRYTIFFDPDRNGWAPWEAAT